MPIRYKSKQPLSLTEKTQNLLCFVHRNKSRDCFIQVSLSLSV